MTEDNRAFLDLSFVPPDIVETMERICRAGFDVWLVGGALRDELWGWTPRDWDLATNATPHEIMKLFPQVVPIGIRHGTVQVRMGRREVEVTTYARPGIEGILMDLGRRDFTVNALALSFPAGRLLDPHGGQKDLRLKVLRAVGNARARFAEDPLRTLRAGRFVSVYGFRIERNTFEALKSEAGGLDRVAQERVRDEMFRVLMGEQVVEAFECMRRGGVIGRVLPEILEGCRKKEDRRDRRDLYRHAIWTVHFSPHRLRVRLAALFHDMAKPLVRKRAGGKFTFDGHREAGARLAGEVMARWRTSRKETREIVTLVENHLLREVHEWSDAAVRHLIARVGPGLLGDLLDLAHADRLSGSAPEGSLEQLHALRLQIEGQLKSQWPMEVKDLAIGGDDVMNILGLKPGPLVGQILQILHRRVLDDPDLNETGILEDLLTREFSETR